MKEIIGEYVKQQWTGRKQEAAWEEAKKAVRELEGDGGPT